MTGDDIPGLPTECLEGVSAESDACDPSRGGLGAQTRTVLCLGTWSSVLSRTADPCLTGLTGLLVAAHRPPLLLFCPLPLPWGIEGGISLSTPPPPFHLHSSPAQGVRGNEVVGYHVHKAGTKLPQKHAGAQRAHFKRTEKNFIMVNGNVEHILGGIMPSTVSREQVKINQTQSSPLHRDEPPKSLNTQGHGDT